MVAIIMMKNDIRNWNANNYKDFESCSLILFHLLLSLHFVTATPPIVHEFRILEPEPIENIYGQNKLRLECTVSGNPLPVLEWSFDSEKFEAGKPFRSTDESAPIFHEISGMGKLAVKVFSEKYFVIKSVFNSEYFTKYLKAIFAFFHHVFPNNWIPFTLMLRGCRSKQSQHHVWDSWVWWLPNSVLCYFTNAKW